MQDILNNDKEGSTHHQPISFEDVDVVSIADEDTWLQEVDLTKMPFNQLKSIAKNGIDKYDNETIIAFFKEAVRRFWIEVYKMHQSIVSKKSFLQEDDDLTKATWGQLKTMADSDMCDLNRIFICDLFKEAVRRLEEKEKLK